MVVAPSVLVIDADDGQLRVSEELWPGVDAKRLMVWGKFAPFIVATIPAKELRAHVRRKGVVAGSRPYKAGVLERAIETLIAGAEKVSLPQLRWTAGEPT